MVAACSQWPQGGPWHMFYGCAADQRNGLIFLGDSSGLVHVVDCRAPQGSHLKAQVGVLCGGHPAVG